MRIIDDLPDVLELIADDRPTEIKIYANGIPVDGRYPQLLVFHKDTLIWKGLVCFEKTIGFEIGQNIDFDLILVYHGKTNQDTKVQNGQIVENQQLEIRKITVDDFLLDQQFLADNSVCNYVLDADKQSDYKKNGHTWKNIRTSVLYDNCIWRLTIDAPVLQSLMKRRRRVAEMFENSHSEILKRLQSQLKRIDDVVQ